MIIYLVDSPLCKIAYTEVETAVNVAIKELEKHVHNKKRAQRQIFSDCDGIHFMRVQQFDKDAVTAYVTAMKVHRKVILGIEDPIEAVTEEITIHKILLGTEESTVCKRTFQDVKHSPDLISCPL